MEKKNIANLLIIASKNLNCFFFCGKTVGYLQAWPRSSPLGYLEGTTFVNFP